MPFQLFTNSGTWTAPSNVISPITVIAVSASGGGGGGEINEEDPGMASSGGGGGGGGYVRDDNVSVTADIEYTITVGGNGIGGSPHSNGTAGGSSSFYPGGPNVSGGSGGRYNTTPGAGSADGGADGEYGGSAGSPGGYGGGGSGSDPDLMMKQAYDRNGGYPDGGDGGLGSPWNGSGYSNGQDGSSGGGAPGGGGGGYGSDAAHATSGGNGIGGSVYIEWEETETGEEVEAAAVLACTISLASSATRQIKAASALSCVASIASTADKLKLASSLLNTTASIASAAVLDLQGASALACSINIEAAAETITNAEAELGCTIGLAAAADDNDISAIVLPCSISLQASSTTNVAARSVRPCTISIAATPTITYACAANLQGLITAAMSAGDYQLAAAELSLSGSIAADTNVTIVASAVLSDEVTLVAGAVSDIVADSSLALSTSINPTVIRLVPAEAELSVSTALACVGASTRRVSSQLELTTTTEQNAEITASAQAIFGLVCSINPTPKSVLEGVSSLVTGSTCVATTTARKRTSSAIVVQASYEGGFEAEFAGACSLALATNLSGTVGKIVVAASSLVIGSSFAGVPKRTRPAATSLTLSSTTVIRTRSTKTVASSLSVSATQASAGLRYSFGSSSLSGSASVTGEGNITAVVETTLASSIGLVSSPYSNLSAASELVIDVDLDCYYWQSLGESLATYLSSVGAVSSLFTTNISPLRFAENKRFPKLCHTITDNTHGYYLSGAGGWSNARVQILLLAQDYDSKLDATNLIRDTLNGFGGYWGTTRIYSCTLAEHNDIDLRKQDGSDDQYYGKELEFDVVYQESAPQFTSIAIESSEHIEDSIFAHLRTIANTYSSQLPEGERLKNPAIVYRRTRTDDPVYMSGSPHNVVEPTFELLLVGRNYRHVVELAQKVRESMQGKGGTLNNNYAHSIILESDSESYNEPIDSSPIAKYWVQQKWKIQHLLA